MEDILKLLSQGFEAGQKSIDENENRFKKVEASLQAYLVRAKETLGQKHVINPKPLKRFMKTIADESEDSEVEDSVPLAVLAATGKDVSLEADKELRPMRTAKSKANQNLKEIPMNLKMRNDNNVVVKMERTSSLNKTNSRESIKENKEPEKPVNQKRKSPDEGIQSACDSPSSERASKRSNSIEVISAKIVEIDLSNVDDNERMPPPSLTKKVGKKATPSSMTPVPVIDATQGLRVTRSKIKQEKVSITPTPSFAQSSISATSTAVSAPEVMAPPPAPVPVVMAPPSADTTLKTNDTTDVRKIKKKYPMPILIKMERVSDENPSRKNSKNSGKAPVTSPPVQPNDETFNIPAAGSNETFQIAPSTNEAGPDTTVTLSRNPNESLMTEDNDDEAAIEQPPPIPPKPKTQTGSALKLKKNEVFNPYLSSPVKQRVQAFEKHANNGSTPERFHTLPSKFGSLKSGTPSKIALGKNMTPLSMTKQRFLASVAGSNVTSSAPANKAVKPLKKMNSLSQESLDDYKKQQAMAQMMEEKRKVREEKQRQAFHAREQMEKEKREQALRQQQERDEKYRKLMKEKEEKQRMEALKKNMKKEKQAKKFAEEKARKDEFAVPRPVDPPGLTKNDSLHLKMQKQLLLDRSLQHQKEEAKKFYGFDMLETDDSTDDESKPSKKRPEAPEWSKKKNRKPFIAMQSTVPASMLDNLFSSRPISVDLKEIFPAIEARKLIRNSSAIWRTPPKQY